MPRLPPTCGLQNKTIFAGELPRGSSHHPRTAWIRAETGELSNMVTPVSCTRADCTDSSTSTALNACVADRACEAEADRDPKAQWSENSTLSRKLHGHDNYFGVNGRHEALTALVAVLVKLTR